MTDPSGAIVREIFIDAAPEDVFPYFTDAEKMVVWKAVSAEIDGRSGGDFRIDVTGAGDVARGAFLEIDAPRRVVFTWAWERFAGNPADLAVSIVEVTLTPDGDGTRLRLVHSGVPLRRRDRSARGWEHYLDRLKLAAAGRDPGVDPWADRAGGLAT
ncbi:MAG: SRPBCC family protein [Solirubrobacteraceae bacterium]